MDVGNINVKFDVYNLDFAVPNIEFDFDVRFLMYLYLLTKPNVEIENYESS